jgi:hypothetical protein
MQTTVAAFIELLKAAPNFNSICEYAIKLQTVNQGGALIVKFPSYFNISLFIKSKAPCFVWSDDVKKEDLTKVNVCIFEYIIQYEIDEAFSDLSNRMCKNPRINKPNIIISIDGGQVHHVVLTGK